MGRWQVDKDIYIWYIIYPYLLYSDEQQVGQEEATVACCGLDPTPSHLTGWYLLAPAGKSKGGGNQTVQCFARAEGWIWEKVKKK